MSRSCQSGKASENDCWSSAWAKACWRARGPLLQTPISQMCVNPKRRHSVNSESGTVRSVIRARGQVKIESEDKKQSVTGDQFALDMISDQAKLVNGDVSQVIDFASLQSLAQAPTAPPGIINPRPE